MLLRSTNDQMYLLFVVVDFYFNNLEERSVCLGREWCFPLGMFLHKST